MTSLDNLGYGKMMVGSMADMVAVAASTPKHLSKDSGGKSLISINGSCHVDLRTGKLDVVVPLTARSDEAGFARTQALQHGKKELMRRRLQAKLAERKDNLTSK